MKYILKIFLIVLLVVAIIGAACWFFLVQRPDLTNRCRFENFRSHGKLWIGRLFGSDFSK